MSCHCIAFLAGFLLDLVFGDPHWLPHPVRLIGKGIGFLEKKWNKGSRRVLKGMWMAVIVLLFTAAVTAGIMVVAYLIHPVVGVIAESILTYYALAVKSLRTESMKVYAFLKDGDLDGARRAVSMIVGRDTDRLDGEGIAKAAVESVAENISDGVTAPMIFLAAGGPVLGFCYKAVNTMDSMTGYKNERFYLFGRVPAKADDVLSFIPARINAFLMMAACLLAGPDYNAGEAFRIYRRDRRSHASPNSAQAESVCAGALGIRLGGDASYFGREVKKPDIGDEKRPVECEDIKRANRLLYVTAVLGEILCLAVRTAVGKTWL